MFLCHIFMSFQLLLTTRSAECSLYSPCINGYIDSTTTVVDYGTAQNATIDIISGDVRCNAGRGCYNSKSIKIENGELTCKGDTSCADTQGEVLLYNAFVQGASGFTNNKHVAVDELYCYADQSCAHSKFTNVNSAYWQSVIVESNSDNTRKINANGAYSLYNSSYTTSNDSISIEFYFYGHYAGYLFDLTCSEKDTCFIECYGSGCYNMKLNCLGTCFYVNCFPNGTSVDGVDCWDSEFVEHDNSALVVDSDRVIREMNDACDLNGMVFDSADDTVPYFISSNGSSICMRSERTAEGSTKIGFYNQSITELNVNINETGSVYCMGYYSCDEVGLIEILSPNGNLICSASHSCYQSSVSMVNNGDVYCLASSFCNRAVLFNVGNLFCTGGDETCNGITVNGVRNYYHLGKGDGDDYININSSGNNSIMNIYLKTYESGYRTNIYCQNGDTCNIYCETRESCFDSTTFVYCDILSDCTISCDSSTTGCPWYPTISPTQLPTMNATTPSIAPTNTPTTRTTIDASNIPSAYTASSLLPISTDSFGASTDVSTSTDTRSSGIGESGKSNPGLENLNNFGVFLVIGLIISAMVIMMIGKIYAWRTGQGSDGPDIFAIFYFIHNVADFWSDLLFCLVLYVDREVANYLFVFALSCVCCPYLVSCCVGVYTLSHWRNFSQNGTYLKRYDVFMFGLTALAGFYATVNLCRSKLLYLNIFNLQLNNREILKLQNYKFINVVILENVPQFVLAVYYLINHLSSSDSYEIVFVSITFSVISIIAACLSQASRICNFYHKRSNTGHFIEKVYLTGYIVIKSNGLQRSHAFAHNKIGDCISHVLTACNDSKQWAFRPDVDVRITVFYIENQINTLRQIEAYFEIRLQTTKDCAKITQALRRNIEEMAKHGFDNHKKFVNALKQKLKLSQRNRPKISIVDLSCVRKDSTKPNEVTFELQINIYADGTTIGNNVRVASLSVTPASCSQQNQAALPPKLDINAHDNRMTMVELGERANVAPRSMSMDIQHEGI